MSSIKGLNKKLNSEGNDIFKKLSEQKVNNKQAIELLEKLINSQKITDRTKTVHYSLLKRKFRELGASEEFLEQFRPPEKLINDVLASNKKSLENKKEITITKSQIKKIIDLKKSKDPLNVALYLLLVSGRRTHELLNAEFTLCSKKGYLKIIGLSKTKSQKDICIFPLLCPIKRFFRLLKYFKESNPNPKSLTILLNLRIKGIVSQDWYVHMLRGIYALINYQINNPENLKLNSYVQSVLCHTTIEASIPYIKYNLSNDEIKKLKF